MAKSSRKGILYENTSSQEYWNYLIHRHTTAVKHQAIVKLVLQLEPQTFRRGNYILFCKFVLNCGKSFREGGGAKKPHN